MKYRVIDLRPEAVDSFDMVIDGVASPEDAVRQALGLEVVRSGAKVNLVARVLWERIGQDELGTFLYLKP